MGSEKSRASFSGKMVRGEGLCSSPPWQAKAAEEIADGAGRRSGQATKDERRRIPATGRTSSGSRRIPPPDWISHPDAEQYTKCRSSGGRSASRALCYLEDNHANRGGDACRQGN
jgi:hypothetical protein